MNRIREEEGLDRFWPSLLPGMSHLWHGYLLRGAVGLFGSFAALLWLIGKLQRMEWTIGTGMTLVLWTILWGVWSLGWHWNRLGLPTWRPSPGRIVSSVMVLIALSNVLMFVLVIGIVTGTSV